MLWLFDGNKVTTVYCLWLFESNKVTTVHFWWLFDGNNVTTVYFFRIWPKKRSRPYLILTGPRSLRDPSYFIKFLFFILILCVVGSKIKAETIWIRQNKVMIRPEPDPHKLIKCCHLRRLSLWKDDKYYEVHKKLCFQKQLCSLKK